MKKAVGPISPEPVSVRSADYLPAYLSNGLLGLRVREVPLRPGVATVSGLSSIDPVQRIESVPFVPYPLAADVRVGSVWLGDALDAITAWEQRYDFSCGELLSHVEAVCDERRIVLDVVTFCSRTQPALVCQEIAVRVGGACELAVRAQIDGHGVPGRLLERSVPVPGEGIEIDGAMRWETSGALTECGLAYATEFLGARDATPERTEHARDLPLQTTYSLRARRGRVYRLRQIVAVVGSAAHGQSDREAVRMAGRGRRTGFDALRRDNAAEWAELWRGRPVLIGAEPRWQALADAAFFYLNSSVHSSSVSSTHIFGLARWHDYHYYYGHVMWDIEVFGLPCLLLVQPHAARAMLDYRMRSVPAARLNAQLNGYRGLQFPWQSGPRNGEEAAPGEGDAAMYEHHVGPAVAQAFVRYGHATGDQRFVRDCVVEVLDGVATWIESRVTESGRGFEIRRAMGIAEREEPSDNVAYVNMSAAVTLRNAVRCFRDMGWDAPARWKEIADALVLPMSDDGRVVLDHDAFELNEEKGATPATLAAIFPLGYELDPEVERATIEYWLKPWREYIGSPMLSALYATWAARIGERELAAELLEEGYAKFVSPRFMNTHEYRSDKFPEQPVAGPFFANLSGFLLNCYFGFTGLAIESDDPDEWCARPVVLPTGWDCIEFERLWVQGRPARLIAKQGAERAELIFDERGP